MSHFFDVCTKSCDVLCSSFELLLRLENRDLQILSLSSYVAVYLIKIFVQLSVSKSPQSPHANIKSESYLRSDSKRDLKQAHAADDERRKNPINEIFFRNSQEWTWVLVRTNEWIVGEWEMSRD